jgi:hypoxanthine phosphoribosyltransferase
VLLAGAEDEQIQDWFINTAFAPREQAEALVATLAEIAGRASSGPAFLVDDIVDSRWTIATIGALLREADSGPVLPVVLAQASGD